ncbi:MAG TPA: hypothetical protein VG710_17795 [Opitutus sp.]|nr:hypothetical protein [Opitutus sp.]
MITTDPRSGRPPCLPTQQQAATPAATSPSRLWLWVAAAFVLQLAVWAAWFIIAAHHPVQEVPRAPAAGR